MRYKITLCYNGSAFCGWQVQSNAPSVQETLQNALSTLLGDAVEVVGAGRTDTGVHASRYVAHFDSNAVFEPERICYKLNAILPKEVTVFDIVRVPDDFHARFSATSRQYKYYIHSRKDPFRDGFSWYCRYRIDVDRMNEACRLLLGTHDCSCFEKTGSDNATSICSISYARWEKTDDDSLVFTIEANRFLRNMVRAIVGTLVDIGRGVNPPEHIAELLEKGTRSDAGQSVPGHALFLSDIRY